MTPENLPVEQQQPKLTEKELTPEQKQEQEVLSMLESKYWVDLKSYIEEQSKVWISVLKMDIQNPNQAQIEQKAKEVYEAYLKREISKPNWVENIVNVENLLENTWNEKTKQLKEQFDKILNPILDKYDFLDKQTKNFVKLWIINSILTWPINDIADSLIWSISSFVGNMEKMDESKLKSWTSNLSSNPKDSWRTLASVDLFKTKISSLNTKLEEINTRLNSVEPKLSVEEKQNIISNVNFFNKPSAIERWVESLEVDKIDLSKKEKNKDWIDAAELSTYMLGSREKIMQLTKKMDLWNGIWEQLYKLSNTWKVWEYSNKITETILKLPIIWKLIAILLWLDPENAVAEFRENSKNYKLLSSLKSLWQTKNNEWKVVEWKDKFKDIDLSALTFEWTKSHLKNISSTLWDVKNDKDNNFWLQAFSENWYWEKDPKFKLDLWDNTSDKKLTNEEFKKIVDAWIKEYKKLQEPKTPWDKKEADKAAEATESVESNVKENALSLLKWKNIEWLTDNLGNWDYSDFKKIKIEDIKNSTDIDLLLKKAIWEGSTVNWYEVDKSDYEELSKEVKDSLKHAIKIVKDFLNENKGFSTYWEWESWWWRDLYINDIIFDKDFKEYLSKK